MYSNHGKQMSVSRNPHSIHYCLTKICRGEATLMSLQEGHAVFSIILFKEKHYHPMFFQVFKASRGESSFACLLPGGLRSVWP